MLSGCIVAVSFCAPAALAEQAGIGANDPDLRCAPVQADAALAPPKSSVQGSSLSPALDRNGLADASEGCSPGLAEATDLSKKTDVQLTELTAQWSTLTPSQRRELLAEVTGRMNASRNASRKQMGPSVGVRVQRRYGRVVRKSDGSVVVQTRVVEVRPRTKPGSSDVPLSTVANSAQDAPPRKRGRVTFGIGFERRTQARENAPSGAADSQTAVDPDH